MGTRLDPDLWIWKKNREKFWDIKKILDSVAETSEKTQCFRYSENPYELEKTLTKIKKILDEGSIKKWNVPSDNEKLEAIEKVIPKARLTTGLTVGNAHNCTSSYPNLGSNHTIVTNINIMPNLNQVIYKSVFT